MNLTDAQRKTIGELDLEPVESRKHKPRDWMVDEDGCMWVSDYPGELETSVVVRPRHAARIAELEAKVTAQEKSIESLTEANRHLYKERDALSAELAPVRALKVGSWQWAMVQHALGQTVREKTGYRASLFNEKGEPYYLHVEPEPEPTAAELAAAIKAIRSAWDMGGFVMHAVEAAEALAARVKRKEPTP